MKFNKELLKGSTNLLVLSLLEKENMYGYQMIKKMQEQSNNLFEFQEGTELITSYWDETGSKKRKYYSITKKGKEQLKEKKEEWKIFSNGINQVLGGVSFAN